MGENLYIIQRPKMKLINQKEKYIFSHGIKKVFKHSTLVNHFFRGNACQFIHSSGLLHLSLVIV